jgi:hypothetical protein
VNFAPKSRESTSIGPILRNHKSCGEIKKRKRQLFSGNLWYFFVLILTDHCCSLVAILPALLCLLLLLQMVHPLELDLPIAKNKRPYHKSHLEWVTPLLLPLQSYLVLSL